MGCKERLNEAAKPGFTVVAVVLKPNLPNNLNHKDFEDLTNHAVKWVEQAVAVVRGL